MDYCIVRLWGAIISQERFEIEGGIFVLLPWVLCSVLSAIVFILCVKIHTLKVSMAEIRSQLAEWM